MQRRRNWKPSLILFLSQLAMGVVVAAIYVVTARAALLPVSALESPVGRFLLGETSQGAELIRWATDQPLLSVSADEFLARLRDPSDFRMSRIREQLESRVARIRESLHEAQIERSGGKDVSESDAFTADERMVLREVASRELSIEASWGSQDPRAG